MKKYKVVLNEYEMNFVHDMLYTARKVEDDPEVSDKLEALMNKVDTQQVDEYVTVRDIMRKLEEEDV